MYFDFQSFVFECDGLLKNRTEVCTDGCKNTLIGLTSTVEGRKLMNVSYFVFGLISLFASNLYARL